MVDALGWRGKFAVIAPSTNTSVQPDFDDMRPHGITNHFSRIYIPDDPVESDDDFNKLMENIRAEMDSSVDRVMTCNPDYFVMGMSSETFWDGLKKSEELKRHIRQLTGLRVAMGSDACRAALKVYGDLKRIAVLTPYWPVGDANVRKFFEDCGLEVVGIKGLCCKSPSLIAHVQEDELRQVLVELNRLDCDAIIQAGTNLSMVRLAAEAERWFDKPVIAINAATYWYALRDYGVHDVVEGYGRLLSEFTELPSGFESTAAAAE